MKSKWLLFGCLGLIGLVFCVGLIILFAVVGIDTTSVSGQDQPPAPSFEEIRAKHDAYYAETITQLEWKDYRKVVEGTWATSWYGWVDEVDGSFRVYVDMDPPEERLSMAEVSFTVPEETARALRPGQPLTFSGEIVTAMDSLTTLDIRLKDVVLE